MSQPTKTSRAGLALIMRVEGFQPASIALGDGRFLIGHNHIELTPRAHGISPSEAEEVLANDLVAIETGVTRLVLAPVTQAQFDSLVSFAFSIGLEAFSKSDVLRRLNAGEPLAAACAMDAWRKSAVHGEPDVLDALVRRRTLEKAQFLDLPAPVGAPSALVKPQIDHACAILSGPLNYVSMPDVYEHTPAPVDADGASDRLTRILASEVATASALRARAHAEVDAEDVAPDDVLVLDRPAPSAPSAPAALRRATRFETAAPAAEATPNVTGLAVIGIAGFGLMAAGVAALGKEGQTAQFLMFTAAGAVMCLMASYYCLKSLISQRGGERMDRRAPAATIA
jgi:lysozyme